MLGVLETSKAGVGLRYSLHRGLCVSFCATHAAGKDVALCMSKEMSKLFVPM